MVSLIGARQALMRLALITEDGQRGKVRWELITGRRVSGPEKNY